MLSATAACSVRQRRTVKAGVAAPRGPRYLYIHAVMRDWIYQGRYRPGSQLPTEDEICRMFGVSRITTRKALALLADERLIVRNPGRGTFVTDDLADAPVQGDMEQLLRKVRRLGSNTRISAATVEVEGQLRGAGLASQLQVAAVEDRYLEVWGRLAG